MRNTKLTKILKLFIFIFAIHFVIATPASVSAQSTMTTESWLATCDSVGKTLVKNKFRYSNSGTKRTLSAAKKKSKKSNCALYVSWCLQQYGAIPSGRTFYATGSGSIHKNGSFGNKVSVIKIYKNTKSAGLKPGDAVLFRGVAHVAIYAGKDSSGRNLWYDGGKSATNTGKRGGKYKFVGKRHVAYLDRQTVSYVIRIKGLQ